MDGFGDGGDLGELFEDAGEDYEFESLCGSSASFPYSANMYSVRHGNDRCTQKHHRGDSSKAPTRSHESCSAKV